MLVGIQLLIALLIGGGIGILFGWLKWRGKNSDARLEDELSRQISQRESELEKLRGQFSEASNARAAAEAKQAEQLAFFKQQLATERAQIETIQEKFRKEFEAVSNKLMVDNTSRFNQQSAESLGKLLAPLKETFGEFKSSLENTRKETATHSALLKEQISRISAEAANLSKALKGDVKVLGNWGENMLDQILEKSGLQRDIHYRRQRGAKDVEGDQRFLDVIVELPEKRNLIVDSKVSLRAYEESVNGVDDAAKLAGLDRHAEALRKHFRDLGAKRYQDIHGINTPDFVLMYVPIEAAFFAAMARTPGLFAEALDNNVVLTTNSTLLATLRTVSHVWRLADQQKYALEIADRGGKLYDKFVGFVEDLQNVGKSLDDAQKAWERASNKLQTGPGNLIRQTEQLKTLGAKAAKSMPPSIVEKGLEEMADIPPLDSTLHLPPE
jgi:DNA recombination protein RmuC